jgi:hypothetical protein
MTDAEAQFKAIVVHVIRMGSYPSPRRINDLRAHLSRDKDMLNGRENRWRGEILGILGWRRTRNSDGRIKRGLVVEDRRRTWYRP